MEFLWHGKGSGAMVLQINREEGGGRRGKGIFGREKIYEQGVCWDRI